MSIFQVVAILKARLWLIILSTIVAGVVSSLIVLALPERYTASTTVLLDIAEPDPVTGRVMSTSLVRNHIRTQIRLIMSEGVAGRVVDQLNLTSSPFYLNAFSQQENPGVDIRYWIGRRLLDNLKAENVAGSDIVAINYTAPAPNLAAQLANAFADAYIAADLDLRVDPARRNAQWFAGQLNKLRQNLNDAQRRLTEYQQRTGIVSESQELNAEDTKLADLTARVTEARAEVSEARSMVSQINASDIQKGGTQSLPAFINSSEIQQWRDELTKIESILATVGGQVGVNHPEYKAMVARREVAQNQLNTEIQKVRTAIFNRVKIAEAKAETLEAELEAQKSRVLRLRQGRDELDGLAREVQIRKAEYDDAFRRAGSLRLEGDIAQSQLVVLEEAVPPLTHSFPKRGLTVAVATVAAVFFGMALAFLLEMIDRRLRSPEDLEQATDLPVLAVLAASKTSRKTKKAERKRLKKASSGSSSQPTPAAAE
ncbi:Wzz/FepE/Etk N-terminal domain-containing protein [Gimibacter soli]|uniref:Wzz/FepE/Etk N-terminal domain-containing protein n=1 Tax=Gimibacter soli TaxID=3024400 RepID=A0AAE9XQR6_9PROT|nr:Wzz/FepE/Etk N-terminal domain-containing protein [Gimibacter soli]WCL53170.1 Wzz/FepE/Etk N-terminal domain-containing protein [Gimibacter soli]